MKCHTFPYIFRSVLAHCWINNVKWGGDKYWIDLPTIVTSDFKILLFVYLKPTCTVTCCCHEEFLFQSLGNLMYDIRSMFATQVIGKFYIQFQGALTRYWTTTSKHHHTCQISFLITMFWVLHKANHLNWRKCHSFNTSWFQ